MRSRSISDWEAKSRVRTIITAAHTRENMDTAIATFEKVGRELGIIS